MMDQMPSTTAAEREEREEQERLNECARNWADLMRKLGPRYADARLSNYEIYADHQGEVVEQLRVFGEEIREQTQAGRGIVLFGPSGTGKDHLLTALMRVAIFNGSFRIEWTNGTDLAGRVRDLISSHSKESEFIRTMLSPDILVISDPVSPWGRISEHLTAMLFRIIDARYRQLRPTWCSMNVATGREAEDKMGPSLVDRLRHDALAINCSWPSYRSKI